MICKRFGCNAEANETYPCCSKDCGYWFNTAVWYMKRHQDNLPVHPEGKAIKWLKMNLSLEEAIHYGQQ